MMRKMPPQAQDTCQLEEMFHHFLSKFSRFHSGHLFDLGHDFLDAFRFIHLDFKGIREGVVLSQGIKELFLFAEPFLEILQASSFVTPLTSMTPRVVLSCCST